MTSRVYAQDNVGAIVDIYNFDDMHGGCANPYKDGRRYVPYSLYMKPGLKETLYEVVWHYGTMDGIFILCPKYWFNKGNRRSHNDMQFAVTGKQFSHEKNIREAARRELAEELAIDVDPANLNHVITKKEPKSLITSFAIYAGEGVNPYDPKVKYVAGKDKKKLRCQIVVAGHEEDLVKLIFQIKQRSDSISNAERQEMRGVALLDLKLAIEYVNELNI